METKTIAVVGAGDLGRRVAYLALRAGYRTILEDIFLTALERASTVIHELLRKDSAEISDGNARTTTGSPSEGDSRAHDGHLAGGASESAGASQRGDGSEHAPATARLLTAPSVEEAVREADLIIETVADEDEVKLELFTIFDKFAKPGAIFATTTRLLSIDDLAEMTFCPKRCIGMRFAAGSAGNMACELVVGRRTSDETVVECRQVARRMGLEVWMRREGVPGGAQRVVRSDMRGL